ncbi:S-adenosyl-L-methionine-dependent methyltransferase [Gigaspora rosea]|uniref:S-adenosyl-L-methionine-dependent methyltransferase n=1 Tax=Gigaspora rosea TaxID=44941 RepID=A0A397VBH1_9GLOM|nr:S-adenosyl-L-methionine-dependent methyltransferase [Gigaspora rosea]
MSYNIKKPISSRTNKVVATVDSYIQYAKEIFISRSWEPLLHFAQNTLLSLMSKIDYGYLRVLSPDHIYEFGPKDSTLRVNIKIINNSFWVRLLLLGDLGFAEAYMIGDVTCDDLPALIKIFVANRPHLDDLSSVPSYIFNTINYVMNSRFANTISNAINNISAHYDISNEVFASFLSNDMTYSSAIFESENDTLEDAQYRKLRMIIKKAKICKDDHLLEIGSGWGSLAIEAVKLTGCRVTTLTLSIEQKNLAEERIAKAGFSSQIEVLLCDYRNLPASHQYDKIISIEMIEAVGPEYLTTYFECCDKFLKEKDSIGVFQVITMPETRYDRYCREVDFIRKYIFPGGHCPTVTTLVQAIHKGSRGRLIVDNIENIGPHYARTLKLWRSKFLEVFEENIRPALIRNWPEMKNDEIEIFKRKWEFYFAYCEGGFVCRILGNVQVVVTREGNKAFLEGIPL